MCFPAITSTFLAYLNSEAELAAVLSHELGHITARHSMRQTTASTAAGIGASIIQILGSRARGVIGDTAINTLGNALLSGTGASTSSRQTGSVPNISLASAKIVE